MSLILDAGGLIAFERGDRVTGGMIRTALEAKDVPITHGGVVGQVWRGGTARQARLGWLLQAIDIVALDESLGREAGLLLKQARTSDVIDAAVVLLATDGDTILTSDRADLELLAAAAGVHVEIVDV